MALKNLVRAHTEFIEEYALSYEWDDCPGAGFSFPCNHEGVPLMNEMLPEALENLDKALNGDMPGLSFKGIKDYSRHCRMPGYGTCACGETVELDYDYGHGIDCKCGRIYNLSGSQLAPRSQWEERYSEESTVPYYAEFGFA